MYSANVTLPSGEPPHVEIDLLGPLVVRRDGVPAEVRGEIARGLVGRLALTPREAVTSEQLVEALWSDPPETAAISVRVNISKLRSGALAGVLHGGRGGYRLDIATSNVDLLRMRAALRGDADDGGSRYDHLLALEPLWSREPFERLVDQPFVIAERALIAEDSRRGAEELAELRLERGEFALAASALSALAGAFPLHERPARLWALALARSGRTSDALDVLDAFRSRVRESQGLDPSAELDALRQSIVRQDPAVVSPHSEMGAGVSRTGIPLPLTSLIGRERELGLVEQGRAEARLVTLVGAGGVGKTRVAIESARRSTRALDDEQWMVDLAVLESEEQVVAAVAAAVGATQHETAAVARRLSGRRTLLILDNAEHVLSAVTALVRELLGQCEGLTVLVTSREPLRLAGERIIPIPPLIGPHAADAERLFSERAVDARGDFAVTPANRRAVRELCAFVDGIPLALELAAAQLDVMSLDDVAASMRRSTRARGTPTAERRHASVGDAIQWSVARLSAAETCLLAQLGGFNGTFTMRSATGVCVVADEDVPELLQRLARKSLVSVTDADEGARRFRLLESVKAFVRSELPIENRAAWDERHCTWFTAWAEEAEPRLRTGEATATHRAFSSAAADLQYALEYAVRSGDAHRALVISTIQGFHCLRRGRLHEGRASVESALAVEGAVDARTRARALISVGLLAYQGGDSASAFEYIGAGQQAAQDADDSTWEALALGYLSYGHSLFGTPEMTEQLLRRAEELMPRVEPWAMSEALLCRGQALRALGRPAQALESLEESHRIARRIGYVWMLTSSTYVTGKVLVDVRRGGEAIDLLVAGAELCVREEELTSALALLHVAAGATALTEQQRIGAAIFGAIDRLGRRYDYNPVAAEGADAQGHRDRVASALTPPEWDEAYAHGATLGFPQLLELAASARSGAKAAA